jgi:hypothetical protein
MVEAVLAGSGLERVAELAAGGAGGPVAIVVPRLGCCAVSPPGAAEASALRRYVAARVRNDVTAVAPGVVAEAAVASGGELVGLVLLMASGEHRCPADSVAGHRDGVLRAAAVAAMTELAVAETAEPPEDNLRAALLAEIRWGRLPAREELLRRARRVSCDLSAGAVVVCADVRSDRPRHLAATAVEGLTGAIAQHLDGGQIHALAPREDAAETLLSRLARHGSAGMSALETTLPRLPAAYALAELALALGVRTVAPAEAAQLRESTVAVLERHDESHGTGLVETVAAAVERDGDLHALAANVGVRELIVTHRLDRVAELTGLDPRDGAARARLALGLLARRAR